MLHVLLARLRWPPDAVWGATPREIALAFGVSAGASALTRHDLDRLMGRFPDA